MDATHVYIVGNCWRDSVAIARWAQMQGVKCDLLPAPAKVGKKIITGGHQYVQPHDSKYYVEYRDGIGIVRIRKSTTGRQGQ